MELEPITRKEKIIAGENLEPITRLEKFLKEYGGSGGSGGGGSSDAVLYTPQTLTDAQKKQARENIDAASSDFVITGTVTGETLTTDKTYEQVQEAVQAGKRVTLKVKVYGIDYVLPKIGESSSGYMFATVATVFPTVTKQFTAVVGASGTAWNTERVASYDSDGNLVQISMDRDPEQAMEIATKQYVDNKECILKSTTPGSTKKFKMTVDDSGAISATEVT